MHKSQVLFYLLSAFILGIFIGSFWVVSQAGILILFLLGTVIFVISGYHGTFKQNKEGIRLRKIGLIAGFYFFIFALGVFRFNQFNSTHNLMKQFADNIIGGKGVSYIIRGFVTSDPENKSNQTKFIFRVTRIIVPGEEVTVDENILVTASLSDIKFGDNFVINGVLSTPKNFSDDFDYISYLKKDGIGILMNYPKDIKRDNNLELGLEDRLKIFAYKKIFGMKNNFESAVFRSVSEPNASFINGILFGTKHNISDDLKDAFRKTGTSHIMAISGYNITIVAWGVMAGLFFFVKRKKAFWISVVIIFIFTIMTGASASVVRASIMGLVLLFASGYGRLYNSRNSLLLAGAIMVYNNPLILRFDIGFQLSFLAVIGLVYFMPVINYWTRKFPDGKIKETIITTLAAQIFVLPLLMYYFKDFSLVAIPTNILVLPFMPVTMLLGFVTGLGGMIFFPIGQLVGYFSWAITKYQITIIENLASLSFSSVTLNISLSVLVIIYALLFVSIWKTRKHIV